MTGFGDARKQNERLSIAVEIRAVNNRYFKMTTKCPDVYAPLENKFEKLVRASIARGTVSLTLRFDRVGQRSQYRLDRDVLKDYWQQLHGLAELIHVAAPNHLGSFLELPGVVVEEDVSGGSVEQNWPTVREAIEEAVEKLQEFRRVEGQSMQDDLQVNCKNIAGELDQIDQMAPQVVSDYRERILARVRETLQESDVEVADTDLIREVSIFSDRCDINEEITRLRSHLQQFDVFLGNEVSTGRKLEFLSQEMFREINTIGSKANNVTIAHCVVEMKAAIEKMREVLQNVE